MWAALGVVVAAGLIFAVKKYKDRVVSQPEQEQQDGDDSGPVIKVRRGIDEEKSKAVHSLNREFKCGIRCESIQILAPDYHTKYTVGAKEYVGYQTLEAENAVLVMTSSAVIVTMYRYIKTATVGR